FRELRRRVFDVSPHVAGIGEAAAAEKRVSARAEAVILVAPPVMKVVAALLAGACEIADLVLRESGARKLLDRAQILVRGPFVIRKRDASAGHVLLQRAPLLQIEPA